MPAEIRSIIFTQEELVSALAEFAKRKGRPLPAGRVADCRVSGDPPAEVVLAIAIDGKEAPEATPFAASDVGAALVYFCIQRKIPLPAKGATKVLRVHGDSLALFISINADGEPDEGFFDLS